MAEQGEQRRLAAIFAADMVGYSRLMEADERGTIARQKTHRAELIDPKITEHHGRIVKTTGDGLLVEFASVVDAVECAVEVQRAMGVREADVPVDRRIRYRVGINLGDIVIEGDDIFGDGVNIASRLEEMAEPGGICVSGTGYDQLKQLVEVGYEYLGERQVKNIERPVRVYKVLLDPEAVGTIIGERRPMSRQWRVGTIAATLGVLVVVGVAIVWQVDLRLPWSTPKETVGTAADKPSILILPFEAAGGDPGDVIFGDAMTEDVIAALTRFPGLRVLGRNTSFAHKGKDVDSSALAGDLGVRYLLEGGIQRVGDRVRIKVRLVEAATDTPVWAESYDREFKDIFAIQDDVTRRVVGTLVSQIGQVEIERTLRKPPDSLEAYAITVQGRRLWRKSRKKSIPEARSLLLQAVEKYPNYAPAYVYLAFTYLTAYNNAWSEEFESPTNMPMMAELARQAILIDDSYGLAHATRGVALTYLGKHEDGLASAERALALNPSDSDVLGRVGQVFNFYGDNERAIEVLKKAMELDPYSPAQWRNFISRAYFFSKQYRDAALAATACIERAPIEPCHVTRIASFGQLGEMKSAHEAFADYKKVNPGAGVETSVARLRRVFRRLHDIPHLEEGLRKAGLPQ